MPSINDVVALGNVVANKNYDLWRHSVIGCWRGSIANGMHNPAPDSIDDIDALLVVIPDEEYYFGLKEFGSRGTVEIKEGRFDILAYEMRKFVRLLEQGNPNVLSTLWTLPEHHFIETQAMDELLVNRQLFVGKHVFYPLMGYAHDQISKMVKVAYTDKAYQCSKRRLLFQQFGFDCKKSAHALRLLRMGIEFLQTGEMTVYRPDAEELLQIKHGEWSLSRIEAEANKLFAEAGDAFNASTLPESVDHDKISRLCTQIIHDELAAR